MANWIQRFIAAIATHKVDVSAHHAKTTSFADMTDRAGKDKLEWTLNKLLKGAGTGSDPTEIDVPSTDYFGTYLYIFHWMSVDGFTLTEDGAGAVTVQGEIVKIQTSATSGEDCFLRTANANTPWFETGKIGTVEWPIIYASDITNQKIWLLMDRETNVPPVTTIKAIGFRIDDAAIFAVSGDNVGEEETDTTVTLSQYAQFTRLKAVFTRGTDCKFYVNGTLKATHTTRLLDTSNAYLHCGVTTNENATKRIDLGRVLIEKEY